ncbi:collagen-like triple helix repeat-containing protein [Halorarius halobius]|uniref:collagen-like triple helix repeat-containing protein n=1 Tax=Halorarius halobius TaxID=2962671 RepID=UPI0020CDB86D|nr:collagen-like protein [Halorarius halobius]
MSRKLASLAMVALLVLSVVAPAAVAAQSSGVAVETGDAEDVGVESATLTGNVTQLDGNATVYFTYWEDGDDNETTTTEEMTVSSTGSFAATVDDLEENTTYTYAAHAETDNGSAVGATETFATDVETELDVETGDAEDVANGSATLTGELDDMEGVENATVGFTYWMDDENASTTVSQTLEETGNFSATVDGLENGTYQYRATATSGNLSDEGDVEEFTVGEVDDEEIEVETGDATDVTNSSATLEGDIEGLDNETATVYFEFSGSNETVEAGNVSAEAGFSAGVSGLENNTTYTYTAYADVNNTTYSGEAVEFTTGADDDNETENETDAFGMEVSAFVHSLLDGNTTNESIGQQVSEFVTANNPGADNRPDHAGPPEDRGPGNETERGPPENAGPDGDTERGPPEDKGPDGNETGGPPENAGPNDDDSDDGDGDDSDGDDDADTSDGGPGNSQGKGNGR